MIENHRFSKGGRLDQCLAVDMGSFYLLDEVNLIEYVFNAKNIVKWLFYELLWAHNYLMFSIYKNHGFYELDA